jgi:hypothetical protein
VAIAAISAPLVSNSNVKVNQVARTVWATVVIAAAAACHSDRATADGFPGLAIEARCRTGSTAPQYSEVEGEYPGERASGDSLDVRFLGSNGELPLPCIDRRAETYRIYQDTGGEFSGFWLVGVSRSANGSRLWAVVKPNSVSEARHVGRAITLAEWESITTRISAMNFWTQPARLLPEPNREAWRGALNLEGYSSDRYHSIRRFYDDKGLRTVMEPFLEIARPLLNKAAK